MVRATSPDTPDYNCIAWAAEDSERWWWPDVFEVAYWPEGVPRAETVASFIEAYRTVGFEICAGPEIEIGKQKIAIYVDGQGTPTHAARQLPTGRWTSKLGSDIDVEHDVLEDVSSLYGAAVVYMARANL